ncbi:MAG: TadE family protein [Candidatus Limnocylindrales bacterium]
MARDRRTWRAQGRDRGQALVEFALVLPILATLLFGLLDVGRVVWAQDSISNAAREGARFAIVHGGSPATA